MSFLVGQSALRRNTHVGLVRQLDSHNSHFKRNEDFYYCSVHNSLFSNTCFFRFVHTTNKINIFFLSVISAAAKSRLMFANRLFRASLSHLAFCWMSLITLAFRKSACSGKETKERVRESRWRRRKKNRRRAIVRCATWRSIDVTSTTQRAEKHFSLSPLLLSSS